MADETDIDMADDEQMETGGEIGEGKTNAEGSDTVLFARDTKYRPSSALMVAESMESQLESGSSTSTSEWSNQSGQKFLINGMKKELVRANFQSSGLFQGLSDTVLSSIFLEGCKNALEKKGVKMIGVSHMQAVSAAPPSRQLFPKPPLQTSSASRSSQQASTSPVQSNQVSPQSDPQPSSSQAQSNQGSSQSYAQTLPSRTPATSGLPPNRRRKGSGGVRNEGPRTMQLSVPSGRGADLVWSDKQPEAYYYKIIASLCNLAKDSFLEVDSGFLPSVSANVKTKVYDKLMKEGIGGAHRLKPDLLTVLNSNTPDDTAESWENVLIPVEAKARLQDRFTQGMTYARATFAQNLNRLYVILMLVGTRIGTIDFVCCSRAGSCLALPQISLKDENTIPAFLETWAYILKLDNWIDSTICAEGILINSRFAFQWEGSCIERRICVRGSATWVRTARHIQDSQTSLSVKSQSGTISKGFSDNPPKTLVVKDAWPLRGSPDEWEVWNSAKGFFGIPDVWGSESFGDTTQFCPEDAEVWDILGERVSSRPEVRQHRRTFYKSRGTSLERKNLSLSDIYFAICDCFLGLAALVHKGKYLHRDISPGNVLMLEKPEDREILGELQPQTKLWLEGRKCFAVLIDADHATCPTSSTHDQGPLTGTWNFLSTRLSRAYSMSTSLRPVTHTLLDDVESILWMLVHLIWMQVIPTPDGEEDDVFTPLRKFHNQEALPSGKSEFILTIAAIDKYKALIPASYKSLLKDGLRPLVKLTWDASTELSGILRPAPVGSLSDSELTALCKDYFRKWEEVLFSPSVRAAFGVSDPTKV